MQAEALHGVMSVTNRPIPLAKRELNGYNTPKRCGFVRCVGALSPAQALGSWPSSKLPLFFFLIQLYHERIYMSIYFVYILD